MAQQENNLQLFHLPERCLIRISGADAESFLQNLVTQDVARLEEGRLIYGCLLTPQGRFLHDFFIFREGDAFYLECELQRREDLIRRFRIFKLRSKIAIEETAFAVYAGQKKGERGFQDPRLGALGYRSYLTEPIEAGPAQAYKDKRIHLGVPEGSIDIKPEIDTLADVNLDFLNGVSWTKGCFVGQEVAARMENRGLVKKRMVIVTGERLTVGVGLTQNDVAVGEIRSVNAADTEGLALLKLAALNNDSGNITQPDGAIISARLPDWLKIENP